MLTERGMALIRECETQLRSLVAEAAASGDYDAVLQLVAWARELATLTGSPDLERESTSRQSSIRKPAVSKVRSKPDYPKFYRRGEDLVKAGWSKRERKEYQHKISYSTLIELVSILKKAGEDGRVFSADDIMPLANRADGSAIPPYQVYTFLGLLKQSGLIDQHGRRGYSIPKIGDFLRAVESAWGQLPQS